MKTRLEKMQEFYTSLNLGHIDLLYYADEGHESFDDLRDALEHNGAMDVYITYYSEAIKFLAENDPSLRNSIGIAEEFGYDTSSLNSELLASLLASEQARQEFYDVENKLEEFFDELNEENDGEEED